MKSPHDAVCAGNDAFVLSETGNLIDLNSDGTISATNLNSVPEHNYVNDNVVATNRDNHREPASLFDVFDMGKYITRYFQIFNKIFIF